MIRIFCSISFVVISVSRAGPREGTMSDLTEAVVASFKDAARKLTEPKRRAFQAQVTLDYLDGSVWRAERVFGWFHRLLTFFNGTSNQTSDFIAHCLEQWWKTNKAQHPIARRSAINLEDGPEISSARIQFMHRMVMFADATGLEVKLVYYPPYRSRYNLIESCWGILELHWKGTLLDRVTTVVEWARTMAWRSPRDRQLGREDLRQGCSHRQRCP
jgi:Rhodopirellula transposase DDE domain